MLCPLTYVSGAAACSTLASETRSLAFANHQVDQGTDQVEEEDHEEPQEFLARGRLVERQLLMALRPRRLRQPFDQPQVQFAFYAISNRGRCSGAIKVQLNNLRPIGGALGGSGGH